MKKNAFTLIELLAVILILGIIALIAIPIVAQIITESKRSSFETTLANIVNVVESKCQEEQLKNEAHTWNYYFDNDGIKPSLDIKGSLPKNGIISVNNSCNVAASVSNGTFTATKSLSSDKVTAIKNTKIDNMVYDNGTVVYYNPVNGTICSAAASISTTGTKTGCMKWYIFNDTKSSGTIDLILDHNTTAQVPWNLTNSNISGPSLTSGNLLDTIKNDTISWTGVPTRTDSYQLDNGTADYTIDYTNYKARLITASEVAKIVNNNSFSETSSLAGNWFYFENLTQTQPSLTVGAATHKWLFNYTNGCTSHGCDIADWVTYGYWTASSVAGSSDYGWFVDGVGSLSINYVNGTNTYGARPVITILKELLQ